MRLPPTPIGLPQPSVHALELPNYGDVPLPFEVQLSQLNKINAANYDFPILVCEDPVGIIPPGGVAHVRFRFQPLEVKDYHVALPVATQPKLPEEIVPTRSPRLRSADG